MSEAPDLELTGAGCRRWSTRSQLERAHHAGARGTHNSGDGALVVGVLGVGAGELDPSARRTRRQSSQSAQRRSWSTAAAAPEHTMSELPDRTLPELELEHSLSEHSKAKL
eukprot:6006606-Alexandrium_andersonii.AAC.1